jgi:hypothetical protein
VVAAVVGVVVALGLLWLLTVLISNRTVTPKGPFTAEDFEVGRVDRLVERVPFPLQDPLGRGRHIFVQHLGDDEEEGWLALSAYAPGQDDETCALVWSGEEFRDPCTDETFPPDGTGLDDYPTRVDDGRLYIDLTP